MKIEYQTVRMLETAHLGLHQLTESDFYLDAVGATGDRHVGNHRMQIARFRYGSVLGDRGRRGQGGPQEYDGKYRINTHCSSLVL
jgi:hypothetical protein